MTPHPTPLTSAWRNFVLGAVGAAFSLFNASAPAGDAPAPPTPAAPNSAAAAPSGKPGVQLWAENCGRCHNIRAQNSLSPSQWEVVMLHMRVRANLPADDARKILAFLKSGH